MKRIMALALVAVMATAVGSPAAFAQGGIVPQFGILGGLNLSKLSIDPTPSPDSKIKVGGRFGAIVGIGLQPMVGLEAGVIFSMEGTKFDVTGGTPKDKLNYVRIPVLIQVAPNMTGPIKPFVKVGPDIGFLASAKYEDADGNSIDIKDTLKSTDFGLDFIGGVGMPFANVNGFIQAGYYLGLTDINDVADSTVKLKNRTISISAGVKMM